MLTIVISIVVLTFTITSGRVLLYNTEDGQSIEKFDCVYHAYDNGQQIPYCRRPGVNVVLNRTEARCANQGVLFSFKDLINMNVQPSDILQWSSSIEMVDMYANFFYNQSRIDDNDRFICNCTEPGTFGKFCEYQLTHHTESFDDAVGAQFRDKQTGDSWNTQKYGQILCYETLLCNSGPLCLDWRDIADGLQRCVDGLDEENWDKLEFNECEKNEFRCTNGMCIPEEFWLDGHVDCMDWSDELGDGFSRSCSITPNAMECDEHICPRDSYSCGDGQCVNWLTRMAFQRLVSAEDDCFNKRNLNHMCEVSPHRRAWTLPNGLCWPDKNYDDPRFPSWNMVNASALTADEKCQYLLRCALSDGLEHDCPCNRLNCTQITMDVCSTNSILIYPQSGLIYPNVLFYYKYTGSKEGPAIDGLIIFGSHRCRGYRATIKQGIRIPYSLEGMMYSRINNIICTLDDSSLVDKDYLSTLQYDKLCYNEYLTFNGHTYAVNPDICGSTGECISQYRINDGIRDCIGETDENRNLDKKYCKGTVGQHRFQCFNDEHQCLPLSTLGTHHMECSNGYDDMWHGGVPLRKRIRCEQNNAIDCDLLKEYIRQSSIKSFTNDNPSVYWPQQTLTMKQMPFRSYCDSFWDLQKHQDEWSDMCQHWVCQTDQYQCRTGQCIELDWVCDGEWDCADASDEEALVLSTRMSTHNARLNGLKSRIDICQKRYSQSPFSTMCDASMELACYLSNMSNLLDIQMNRPCINLTQIGDGVEDCYNAYDEKNTFETNSDNGNMWGFHLRCGNHSIPYSQACLSQGKNDCTKILCSNHRSENGTCSNINDVMCLDGRCVKNGRCNGIRDCPDGEDEYWCPSYPHVNNVQYRGNKKQTHRSDNLQLLPQFPSQKMPITRQKQLSKRRMNWQNNDSSPMLSYICNRGVAVLHMGEVACLCPPAYYGHRCEFYSDRISVIAQFDQTTLLMSTLKIKAKLLVDDKIIDDHEFTIMPTIETPNKIKHQFYLLYSRSAQMLTHKRHRYFNRSDVINNHPYSVHFDVYSLENNNKIRELGSWYYPIYFDYLPAYRLATVLKFPTWFLNKTVDPCSQNTCGANANCMPIFNQNNSYYCSCKDGFHGNNCEFLQTQCQTYCSSNALCRSNGNSSKPSCICPLNHFGLRCTLNYTSCEKNPCENNGTCHVSDMMSLMIVVEKHLTHAFVRNDSMEIAVNMN